MKKMLIGVLTAALLLCVAAAAAGPARGRNYIDADGDGVCDNFGYGGCAGSGFVAADGVGVCDNRGDGACGNREASHHAGRGGQQRHGCM